MPNMGPAGADGAFERFLTAAIATIVTIMFSWRLLLDEEEAARSQGGELPLGASSRQESPGGGRVLNIQTRVSNQPMTTGKVNNYTYDKDDKSVQSQMTNVVQELFEPEQDLDLQATPPTADDNDDDNTANETLTTWDDYKWEEDLDDDGGSFHTRRSVRDFLKPKTVSETESQPNDNLVSESTSPQVQSFTQRLANFQYRETSGGSGYIDLYPDVESDDETESSDEEHVYEVQVSDSDSDSGEDGGFFGVTALEPIMEEEFEETESSGDIGAAEAGGLAATETVLDKDTGDGSKVTDYNHTRSRLVCDSSTDIDTCTGRSNSPDEGAHIIQQVVIPPTTQLSQTVYDFTPEQFSIEGGGTAIAPEGCFTHIQQEKVMECDFNTVLNTPEPYTKISVDKLKTDSESDKGDTRVVVQKLDNKMTEITGNTAFVIDLSQANSKKSDPELKTISDLSDDDSLPPSPIRTCALDDFTEEKFSDTESCSSESIITVLSARSGDFDLRGLESEENRFGEAVNSSVILNEGQAIPQQYNINHDPGQIGLVDSTVSSPCPELQETFVLSSDRESNISLTVGTEQNRSDSSYDDESSTPESKSTESLISPENSPQVLANAVHDNIVNGVIENSAPNYDNVIDNEYSNRFIGSDSSSDSSDPPLREYDPDDDDLAEFQFNDNDPDSFYLLVGDEGSLRNFETFTNLDSVGLSPEYSDAVTSGTLSESAKGFRFSKVEEISSEFRRRGYYTDRLNASDSDNKSDAPLSPISSEDEENRYDRELREIQSTETNIVASAAQEQNTAKSKVESPRKHPDNDDVPPSHSSTQAIDFKKYIIPNDINEESINSHAGHEKEPERSHEVCKSIDINLDEEREGTLADIDQNKVETSFQGGEIVNYSSFEESKTYVEPGVNRGDVIESVPVETPQGDCDRLIDNFTEGIESGDKENGGNSDDCSEEESFDNGNLLSIIDGDRNSLVKSDREIDDSTQTIKLETNVDDIFVENVTALSSLEQSIKSTENRLDAGNLETCVDSLVTFPESESNSALVHESDVEKTATKYETCVDDLLSEPKAAKVDTILAETLKSRPSKETSVDDIFDGEPSLNDVDKLQEDIVQYPRKNKQETCVDDLFTEQILEQVPEQTIVVLNSSPGLFANKQNKQPRSQSRETCIDEIFESQPVTGSCQDVQPDREGRGVTSVSLKEEGTTASPVSDPPQDHTSTDSNDTHKQIKINQNVGIDPDFNALVTSDPTQRQGGYPARLLADNTQVKCHSDNDTADICHSLVNEQNLPNVQDSITSIPLVDSPERAKPQQFKGPEQTIAAPRGDVKVDLPITTTGKQSYQRGYSHSEQNDGDACLSEEETKDTEAAEREIQLPTESERQDKAPVANYSDNFDSLSTDLDSVPAITEVLEKSANLSLSNLGSYDNYDVGQQPGENYRPTFVTTSLAKPTARDGLTSKVTTACSTPSETDFISDEGVDLHNEFASGDTLSSLDSSSFISDRDDDDSLSSIERSYNSLQDAFELNRSRVLDRSSSSRIIRTPVQKPSDFVRRSSDYQGAKKRVHRHKAKQYFSVLQQPVTSEKVQISFSTPTKEVPPSRQRISQSRQKFLSAENLADSFEDKFLQHRVSLVSSTPRKYLKRHERHLQDRQSTESLPADISFLNSSFTGFSMERPPLPPRSPKNIQQLYSPRHVDSSIERPDYDKLHENCMFSPHKREEIRHSTKSLENMFEQLLRYGSISSLVETDLDTGQSSQTDLSHGTDISDYISFQYPLERAASMSALTGSSDGHRLPRKPGKGRFASRQVPKSKSLQTLETNLDDVFADEIECSGGELKKTPSVHELRVSKSLSKLTVPDWFKKSSFSRSGSTQSLFTYARQGSTSTLGSCAYPPSLTSSPCPSITSQSNAVVIKTRVTPSSSSSSAARLIRAPMLPTTPEKAPIHPSTTMSLPSDKYRQKATKELKPITIIPFAKIREMFEKKSRKKDESSKTSPRPPVELSPTGEKPAHVSDLASKFQPASPTSPTAPAGDPMRVGNSAVNNHQVPPVPDRKPIITDRSRSQTDGMVHQQQQQQNSLPRKPQVHFSDENKKRRYSSLLENNFAEQLNDLQNTENVFSFPVLSIGEHSSGNGPEDIRVILTNACLNQLRNGYADSGHIDNTSLEEVLEGLLALKEQREASLRMEGVRSRLNLSADYPSSPESPSNLLLSKPQGYVSDESDNVFKDCNDNDASDDNVDIDYVLVKCENPGCRRETNLREARKGFKTCHSCFTYYCGRECRKNDWEIHKQKCVYSRLNSACKHIVKAVNRNPEMQYYCSRLARRGYLSHGRGCVVFAFPDLSSAEDFLYYGIESLWVPPVYICMKDLPEAEMLGDRLEMLSKTCQQYNPELKYVIHVAIVIPPRLPPVPTPRKRNTIIQKVAKLRLSPAHMHPKPQEEPEVPTTMILTAVPGNSESDGTNDRKARELCFINIQRKLRQRGVSLRHQYPNVYNKLIDFVSDSKHFSPLIIYPQDSRTGRRFMCVIMPESEPEIEWIRESDPFQDLDTFDDVDYDSSPLNLSVPELVGPDTSL